MLWILEPLKILMYLVARSPWTFQKKIGQALGVFWFDILRIRRQVILRNLALAFPKLTLKERVRLGRDFMKEFGCNLVEYCEMPFLSPETLSKKFQFHHLHHLDKGLAQGKGVLLLTLHLGHGDLAIAALALKGYKVHVVSKTFKNKSLNKIWFGMREKIGVRFIPPRHSSYSVLKALKQGGLVVFVLDQFTGPPIGARTTFFGHETGTGLGLAVMAERSGAIVVPGYTVRTADGLHHLYTEPPIEFPPRQESPSYQQQVPRPPEIHDKTSRLTEQTQIYNNYLETFVKRHPTQWMWLHQRWKVFRH